MSLTDNTLVKACEYFQLASNYMCKGGKKIIFHICFLIAQLLKTPWGLLLSDETRDFKKVSTFSVRPVPLNSLSLTKNY